LSIDVSEQGSDGWWMQQLWRQLSSQQKRFQLLEDYRCGRPRLVLGSEAVRSAFARFQRVARSNFADVIVQAMTERMAVRAIRTAKDSTDNGDDQAQAMWKANALDIFQSDVYRMMATFGIGYTSLALPDDGDETDDGDTEGPGDVDFPLVTVEDPRQVVTIEDPVNPLKTRAAFKLYHDQMAAEDVAILWLPGRKIVATRPRAARIAPPPSQVNLTGPPPLVPVSFSAAAFTIDEARSESYSLKQIPVVPFGNRDRVGEFELHLDLLDRINHMILQRIVIATMQAFKQRAIELSDLATDDPNDPRGLPTHDDEGNPIDYDDLFSADPGALWRLPVGAKIWESQQADITGILTAVKDDAMHLAVVTRTPFSMFTPDAANQSAEGAQLQREGLVFKVEDRCRIAARSWAEVMSIAFQMMGDSERAPVGGISVDWVPAERYSLAERSQADASALSLPWAQKMRIIWGMTPAEVQIAQAQRAQDAMLAAVAAPQAPTIGGQPNRAQEQPRIPAASVPDAGSDSAVTGDGSAGN
jgi:hypothetical protein